MTVKEFLAWSEHLPDDARYELVAGAPLRMMLPTTIRQAQIQRNASDAMRAAMRTTGGSCEVFDAGPGVAVWSGRRRMSDPKCRGDLRSDDR
jgi:hypothetical protein